MTTLGECHHRPRTDDGSNFPSIRRSLPRSIRRDEDEHVDQVFFRKQLQMLRPLILRKLVCQVTSKVVVAVVGIDEEVVVGIDEEVVVCVEEIVDIVVVVVGMVVERVVVVVVGEMIVEKEISMEKMVEVDVVVVERVVVVVVVDDSRVDFPMFGCGVDELEVELP